jgi:hypothetical protein
METLDADGQQVLFAWIAKEKLRGRLEPLREDAQVTAYRAAGSRPTVHLLRAADCPPSTTGMPKQEILSLLMQQVKCRRPACYHRHSCWPYR